MSTENALLTILAEKIKNDTLVLPTLPDVAVQIRKAADDPDINLNKMAAVISHDAALSARMLKIANSAYMGRTIKVATINQAVNRIGLRQIKNIATALAMEQLFVSQNAVVKLFMSKIWDLTIDVSAGAMATLKAYIARNKHTSLSLDTITLAAMVHNIGVLPILTEAEKHEEIFANPEFLEEVIPKLAGKIGGSIMRAWSFNPEFVTIAEKWNDRAFDSENICYTDFVRISAVRAGVLKVEGDEIEYLQQYVDKGILTSVNDLQSDEFKEQFSIAKAIFKE